MRLFHWGARVPAEELITKKIVTQAALAVVLLFGSGSAEGAWQYLSTTSESDLAAVRAVVLWSGVVVNAVAPLLQVGGQQAVGPARAQVLLLEMGG